MNWEAIGAIGEILGALAVVATLAYLALQVRTVRDQTSVSAHQHIYDSINEFSRLLAESDSLSKIVVSGRISYSALSEEDRVRFDHVYGLLFNCLESWLIQTSPASSMRERSEAIENIREAIRIYCSYPGVAEYWEHWNSLYTPELNRLFREMGDDA